MLFTWKTRQRRSPGACKEDLITASVFLSCNYSLPAWSTVHTQYFRTLYQWRIWLGGSCPGKFAPPSTDNPGSDPSHVTKYTVYMFKSVPALRESSLHLCCRWSGCRRFESEPVSDAEGTNPWPSAVLSVTFGERKLNRIPIRRLLI